MSCRIGLKGLDAEEVHAVSSTRACYYDEPSHLVRGIHTCTFAGDKIVRLMRGLHVRRVVEDVRIATEDAGNLAQALLPGCAVELQLGRRRQLCNHCFLSRE